MRWVSAWIQGVIVLCIICAVGVSLSSCGVTKIKPNTPIPSSETAGRTRPMPPEPIYRLSPGDDVELKFFYAPEMSQVLTVRPDGHVNMMFHGDVYVAGMSATELHDTAVDLYSQQLKRTDMVVNIRSFSTRFIFLSGEISAPGKKRLAMGATLTQVLSDAGGFKESARTDNVVILRRGPNDERQIITVDVDKIFNGASLEDDIVMQPMDTVFVPRSDIAEVNMWVDRFLRRNIPISIGASAGTWFE